MTVTASVGLKMAVVWTDNHRSNLGCLFCDLVVLDKRNTLISSPAPRSWTNNNSESGLKQAIDWKRKPLTDLIDSMHRVVCGQ